MGGHHHRLGRATTLGFATVWDAHHRGRSPAADSHNRRVLLHRDFRSSADPTQLSGNGTGTGCAAPSSIGDVIRRHRYHRRDRNAPQPVLALSPPTDTQAAEGRTLHAARATIEY